MKRPNPKPVVREYCEACRIAGVPLTTRDGRTLCRGCNVWSRIEVPREPVKRGSYVAWVVTPKGKRELARIRHARTNQETQP